MKMPEISLYKLGVNEYTLRYKGASLFDIDFDTMIKMMDLLDIVTVDYWCENFEESRTRAG